MRIPSVVLLLSSALAIRGSAQVNVLAGATSGLASVEITRVSTLGVYSQPSSDTALRARLTRVVSSALRADGLSADSAGAPLQMAIVHWGVEIHELSIPDSVLVTTRIAARRWLRLPTRKTNFYWLDAPSLGTRDTVARDAVASWLAEMLKLQTEMLLAGRNEE